MSIKHYDIILIGSGISSLYSALKIKEANPQNKLSFLILEKYKKQWIGGRASNEEFYGTEIVTGAGIGRKSKDKLLYNLVKSFKLTSNEYIVNPQYSQLIKPVNVKEIINNLKQIYKKTPTKYNGKTFKEFAKSLLGEALYKDFITSAGYTDYENEDVNETLFYYGMDDNACCWKAFTVPWRQLVLKMADKIGYNNFKFSSNVVSIEKVDPCKFIVSLEKGQKYSCNKIIIGTTIDTLRKLLPKYNIYNEIEGQPFLRLYGKFSASSIPIMKEYVKGFTFMPGPLQRIIPIDPNKGVYMIAYNDNKNTLTLKKHLENNTENRELYCRLLEKSLGIPQDSLSLIAIKDFYWPIGTHYYKPLNNVLYRSRDEFVSKAQHPENGILVVGECVSRNQGWTEGALESVEAVVTKKWILTEC